MRTRELLARMQCGTSQFEQLVAEAEVRVKPDSRY